MEKSLGYQFGNLALLEQALTHGSVRESQINNERLEFLGDGVLNCVISSALYERYPQLSEGKLSLMRSALVRNEALSGIARGLQLSAQLRLGGGERASGLTAGDSILADALEAVYGALFIDGGYAAARDAIMRTFAAALADFDASRPTKDAKTRLQEYLQGRRHPPPKYFVVLTKGEPHRKTYEVECVVAPLDLRGTGSGRSRRAAEQDAAEALLGKIGN
ncbi:MAG: ribonuclease III [Betaproteobacteria bacterium]|nr:ribonuclease III [Betaproteobacteria bacterium]